MKISELSLKYNLSADTLRYYEKIGLMEVVSKNTSGIRDYQEEDLKRIYFLKCMRTAGLSIETLKNYVDLYTKGDDTILQRKAVLTDQKEILQEQIDKLQDTMDYLNTKINNYNKMILEKKIKEPSK